MPLLPFTDVVGVAEVVRVLLLVDVVAALLVNVCTILLLVEMLVALVAEALAVLLLLETVPFALMLPM